MAWTVFTPTDVDHLCAELNRRVTLSWWAMYRGQSDASWTLRPSLLRDLEEHHPELSEGGWLEREIVSVEFFRKKAPLRLLPAELPFLEYVSSTLLLMQHYGACTRMLDWSLSPWVAGYFAAIDHPKKDGAIWVVDGAALNDTSPAENMSIPGVTNAVTKQPEILLDCRSVGDWKKISLALQGNQITCLNVRFENSRMSAQQSVFTVAGHIKTDHIDIGQILQSPTETEKIIIPAEMKLPLLRRLVKMNLVATNLFPDITGIARHAREAVRHQPIS